MDSYLKIKVFVVDDDNLTIDLMVKPFQASGFIDFFGRANSGEECLEKLQHKTPDLIIMDINMPGMNGIETVEKLLTSNRIDSPKIIFLTVFSDFEYAQKALMLKASLIGKNIGIDYLIDSIKRISKGEIIINPNPNGIIKEDNNAKLKFALKRLLSIEQLNIAALIRNGKTALQIGEILDLDVHHINNQKKEIKNKLKPLNVDINAAYLGALFERSGLFQPLRLENLDTLIASIRNQK